MSKKKISERVFEKRSYSDTPSKPLFFERNEVEKEKFYHIKDLLADSMIEAEGIDPDDDNASPLYSMAEAAANFLCEIEWFDESSLENADFTLLDEDRNDKYDHFSVSGRNFVIIYNSLGFSSPNSISVNFIGDGDDSNNVIFTSTDTAGDGRYRTESITNNGGSSADFLRFIGLKEGTPVFNILSKVAFSVQQRRINKTLNTD